MPPADLRGRLNAAESIYEIQKTVQTNRASSLAQHFDVHPNQIAPSKAQLLESEPAVFDGRAVRSESAIDMKSLHAKIGELTLENVFWKVRSAKASKRGEVASGRSRTPFGFPLKNRNRV